VGRNEDLDGFDRTNLALGLDDLDDIGPVVTVFAVHVRPSRGAGSVFDLVDLDPGSTFDENIAGNDLSDADLHEFSPHVWELLDNVSEQVIQTEAESRPENQAEEN
jgi:hypothetical protein